MKIQAYTKKTFPVLGMSCAACAVSVESMLKNTDGVKDAAVNYANQTAWAEVPQKFDLSLLKSALQSVGYDMVIDVEDPQASQQEAQQKYYAALKQRTIISALLSLPVVAIGMFYMDMPYGNWISMLLTAPVVFWFGRSFFVHAWKQARYGKANMDTLVALSTGIAFVFSLFNTIYPEFWHNKGLHAHVYYEAASVVITFISLGKLLEERAKSNTSFAFKKLIGLQPKTVVALINGNEQEIAIAKVQVGYTLLVKPGDKIPVDGKVSSGKSFVDESTISGEPIAIEKKEGDRVFAGTINQKGSFLFTAEKVGGDTILAQIIKMVQEAQGSKAPVQKLVDKIAGVFVPTVMGIAILTFIVWMVFGGDDAFIHALLTSVTVLVIACPCALGLATPTAIMVGVGKGAENNMLIKDAESLELAHRVSAIILDKTGTITEGKPVVIHAYESDVLSNMDKQVLFSIESQSEHPLAEALVNYLRDNVVERVYLKNFESITGKGVKAAFNSTVYYVGNKQLMLDIGIVFNEAQHQQAAGWQSNAQTVIYFANNKKVLMMIAIADKIKDTSANAINLLKKRGVDVYMLTGDNKQTAEAVAKQVGITHFKAEVLPADKANFIKQLQINGKIVAMVGDGINDSEALAQADVSIAMGKGSDIAMDVAKITLITSDLQLVPKALMLSSKTVKGIRQNLFWAFFYNVIGIPLAAGVLYPINGFLLDPMIAGAAMGLSSVSVVGNSLRLKFVKL
jgi:Cu2+-exporting ATPase